ncbi:MAG: trypsin-like peptidase domain-containing protein [Epsilonproteobacteria bacterium]|nr:trypsin-like peptidase domain-containing protein [Campylobacterota bacterium]
MGFIIMMQLFSLQLLAAQTERIKDAIVKIYTVSQQYDYQEPWNTKTVRANGSGAIIEGNRILTNAHVVANHTYIEVKRYGTTKRLQARILFISHQADLAIITVDDKEFFEGVKPLDFDALPNIQQKVDVYGFPAGGNTLSVTTGIVSRIEHRRYVHGGEKFLAIQVDAAINSGNSGGPAVSDGKIVGVVMQGMIKSQNIGYLVPVSMIRHFLDDIADGRYDGFVSLGVSTQKMESSTLRKMYGLDGNSSGQLVIEIVYNSTANKVLKVGDIITHIDDKKVNNDGTIAFREHQFTSYKYGIDKYQVGESVTLRIIRNKKPLLVKLKLENVTDEFLLVKTTRFDKKPTYFIYGGYVFVPLTKNLLLRRHGNSTKLNFLASKWPTESQKEIVVMLKVLASELTQGNYNIRWWVPHTINGEKFDTFTTFYQKMMQFQGDYLLLEDDEGVQVAIDTKASIANNEAILKRYNIKYDKSEDLPAFSRPAMK